LASVYYFKSNFANYRSVSTIVKENLLILIRKPIQQHNRPFCPRGLALLMLEMRPWRFATSHIVSRMLLRNPWRRQRWICRRQTARRKKAGPSLKIRENRQRLWYNKVLKVKRSRGQVGAFTVLRVIREVYCFRLGSCSGKPYAEGGGWTCE
jgi:hypothetical protein